MQFPFEAFALIEKSEIFDAASLMSSIDCDNAIWLRDHNESFVLRLIHVLYLKISPR